MNCDMSGGDCNPSTTGHTTCPGPRSWPRRASFSRLSRRSLTAARTFAMTSSSPRGIQTTTLLRCSRQIVQTAPFSRARLAMSPFPRLMRGQGAGAGGRKRATGRRRWRSQRCLEATFQVLCRRRQAQTRQWVRPPSRGLRVSLRSLLRRRRRAWGTCRQREPAVEACKSSRRAFVERAKRQAAGKQQAGGSEGVQTTAQDRRCGSFHRP
mmetsp:Transcript_36385/g.84838  ORF Transcript_36385/g.84838 Transcript_36385/m.84838 type:complete len:210 (-) Transcript_36385:947-1576(-)